MGDDIKMRTGNGRRWAALLLCLAMVISTVGADSPASGTDPATVERSSSRRQKTTVTVSRSPLFFAQRVCLP